MKRTSLFIALTTCALTALSGCAGCEETKEAPAPAPAASANEIEAQPEKRGVLQRTNAVVRDAAFDRDK